MAKKATQKRAPKAEFKGYLNVNLTAEQEAEFDAWYGAGSFTLDLLFETLDFGYKIAFSIDDFNDGIAVTMYAKSTKLDWAGWTLSAWAGTLDEAAAFCFYKHWFVANQDWNQFTGRPQKSHASRG